MKFKDKYNVSEEFNDIFSFSSEEEELEHDAQMLMFQFLEEVEKSHEQGPKLKKKNFAKALNLSPSFITQLYAGEKLISFPLLAKIQKAFNITFKVQAILNDEKYNVSTPEENIPSYLNDSHGFWVWKSYKPDYTNKTTVCNKDFLEQQKGAA